MTPKEEHLLQDSLDQLTELLPDSHSQLIHQRPTVGLATFDAQLALQVGDTRLELAVEVKSSAPRLVTDSLLSHLREAPHAILVTDYVSSTLGETLRHQGINYLDRAGNLYLHAPGAAGPLFVWIEGRKIPKVPGQKADHAFTKMGLKVTYWLLTHPHTVNQTVRTIAQAAGVSLDTVQRARTSLQQQGYLVEVYPGEWKLIRRQRLLDKWTEAYATRLQPGLLRGRYRRLKSESLADWDQLALDTPLTQWGGEPAADALTHNLQPAEWILYTRQLVPELLKSLRLIPDPTNGPIRVYEKFWPQDEPTLHVHPLLVYADLLVSGDPRNAQVAQQIQETHVQHLLD